MDCDERFYALRFKRYCKKPATSQEEKLDVKTPLAG
jgi:hypothetical protein